MRSSKLPKLTALAIVLLALTAPSALARPSGPHSARPSRACRVRLEVPKAPIAAGEPVTILGSLKCARAEEAVGKAVTLYQQAAPKPGYTAVAAATTEANGAFSVTPAAFNTNSTFYAVSEGAKSGRRAIKVSALVTPEAPTPAEGAQLFTAGGRVHRARNRVTFAGSVSPADAGAFVVLQRENSTANEEWRRIDVGQVNGEGKYSIAHDFAVPGDANIRVVVRPHGLNVPSASTPASYEISQTQNPALTLQSSSDPLVYGQSVTLKGVVAAAGANTPVTLLARTKGGRFAAVAVGHTDAGGAYEFTQTPLASTFYRVTTATTKSAVVFEGVKYALTVAPTPSAAQAGQPLTFSGTVLPALAGHVVYLERQNSLRIGWHVIDVGTVGTAPGPLQAAPFSIVHALYSPGVNRLRIKIPGDPGNQGFAASAFEVTVTPTPASVLAPQAPGITKLPSQGQL